jgi:hypothetical protein
LLLHFSYRLAFIAQMAEFRLEYPVEKVLLPENFPDLLPGLVYFPERSPVLFPAFFLVQAPPPVFPEPPLAFLDL